jgi:hypothetical protein
MENNWVERMREEKKALEKQMEEEGGEVAEEWIQTASYFDAARVSNIDDSDAEGLLHADWIAGYLLDIFRKRDIPEALQVDFCYGFVQRVSELHAQI